MFAKRLAVASLLVAACSGSSTPSVPPPTAAATAAQTATPAVTAAAATPTATATRPAAVLPGEPWLVFAWYPDILYLVRPDGSDRHAIDIDAPGVKFSPAWAPDGNSVVFVMRGETSTTPNGSIWTAKVDGTGAAMLTDGNGECSDGAFWPSWSPDGTQLAFVCYWVDKKGGWTEISLLDPVSGKRTGLARYEYPETIDNPLSWAPDGSALAFEVLTWDPTDQFVSESVVATIPAAGGKPKSLTDPALFAAHPDWSPDGKLITFNTYDTGNIHSIRQPSNVSVIRPDGTRQSQLSTASVDGTMRLGQPFWSIDGTRIWVSVAYDYQKDSYSQFRNVLGWVDVATGEFHEIGTEGKRFRERPMP